MPVKCPALTFEQVCALLRSRYGRTAAAVTRIASGSTNCYRVETDAGCFFLKQLPAKFGKDALDAEFGVTAFLSEKGFPTAQILPTTDGDSCAVSEGHLFTLQPFLPGGTYSFKMPPPALPHSLLSEGAKYLGKLQTLLASYPGALPSFPGDIWFAKASDGMLLSELDAWIAMTEARPDDKYTAQILGELLYREQLALRIAPYLPRIQALPRVPTHGDYLYCQWLCEKERIRAVIDFSSVCTAPKAFDLLRSYLYADRAEHLDTEDCCAYVRTYLTEASLSEEELAAAPYLLLAYLLTFIPYYNYKSYLTRPPEDTGNKIGFQFRLTALCRKLDRDADKLSEALRKCR